MRCWTQGHLQPPPRPNRIPLLILACGESWHPRCSGRGIICNLQYHKPEIVLPVFSVSMQAVFVVDVHSTVTSNRLDHSLLVPVLGCTGTILSGFQSVRLPLDKKTRQKKNPDVSTVSHKTIPRGTFLLQCRPLTPLSFSDISGFSFLKYECVNSKITFTIFFFAVKVALKYDIFPFFFFKPSEVSDLLSCLEERAEQVRGVDVHLWGGGLSLASHTR